MWILRRPQTRMPLQSGTGATVSATHFGSVARSDRSPHRSARGGVSRHLERSAGRNSSDAILEARWPSARTATSAIPRRQKNNLQCPHDTARRSKGRDCKLSDDSQELIPCRNDRALTWSARAYDRDRKVSCTIADLEGAEAIAPDHVSEALSIARSIGRSGCNLHTRQWHFRERCKRSRRRRDLGVQQHQTKPHRVVRRRTKNWKMPANTVYVGRPTVWGNPFVVGSESSVGKN